MTDAFSRRKFVTTVATTGAGLTILPRHVLGRGFQAPSDTLNIATVGINGQGSTNTRNLPYEAAMAVSHGLPPEEGLRAVTLSPAQILGVEKDLGSISAGKRANLVLTNGDILQASTQVLGLFIDGKPLAPTSKHTRLYERYLERLKEVKEGRAPLGTK